jgi:hypothetical protein
MTNYQLAKLVNFRLAEEGMAEVRPQQIYNVRKGRTELDGAAALEWIERYVSGRKDGKSSTSVDPAAWFATQRAAE